MTTNYNRKPIDASDAWLLDSAGKIVGVEIPRASNQKTYLPGSSTDGEISGTTITATTQFLAPIGSASTPSYAFTGDPTTGFYNNGGNGVVFVSTGAARTQFGSGGRVVTLDGYTLGTSIVGPDVMMTRYAAKQLMISGDGVGATTNAGLILGYWGSTGVAGIWPSTVTPSGANSVLYFDNSNTILQSGGVAGNVYINTAGVTKITQATTAGAGPSITAGTATTDVAALSVTRTNNNAAVATGVKFTFTDTTSAAGFLPLQILGGAAGTTNLLSVDKTGNLGTSANAGTPGTGVTAVESGDGKHHVTTLTVSTTLPAIAGGANLGVGKLLYTFPAGVQAINATYMSIGITQTQGNINADTPEVGIGTVIASGAVATLDGTATFEDIITGQVAANCTGTATVTALTPTASPFKLITLVGGSKAVYLNVADGWAASGDAAALLAGTVTIDWTTLA